jgi:hypothetical protein
VTVDAAHAALIPYCLEYDVVTYHGYNDRTLPPGPQDKATIQNLRKVFPDSRLWDTEFGPGSPTSFATPDAARLWALRSFMAREQGGLELACWYQWDNQTHGPCQDTTGAITVLGQAILDYCSIT